MSIDTRRLVFGLSVVILVAGALLASFAPGGLFNQTQEVPLLGTVPVRPSPWSIIGYVLLVVSAAGFVLAFAMKPPPEA